MNTRQIIEHIDEMTDDFCVPCPIKQTLVREQSKTAAHRFCITDCSIGQTLQRLGEQLQRETTYELKKADDVK